MFVRATGHQFSLAALLAGGQTCANLVCRPLSPSLSAKGRDEEVLPSVRPSPVNEEWADPDQKRWEREVVFNPFLDPTNGEWGQCKFGTIFKYFMKTI